MSGRLPNEAWSWSTGQENPQQARAHEPVKAVSEPRRVLQDVSNKQRATQPGAVKPETLRPIKRRGSDALKFDKRARRSFVRRIPLAKVAPVNILRDDDDETFDDDREPQMCAEYADDIYTWIYELQEQYMVDPEYINALPASLRWPSNRSTLVNWMILLSARFYMVPETLYLSVNVVDRFLESESVPLDKIQLLGAAALFLSAKYEEVATPSIQNYAIACNADESEVRAMERRVLVALDFRLGYPSPLNFLRRISKADDYDLATRTIGKFLLEIMLVEKRLLAFRPSDVAAAAMLVARYILGITAWTTNFVYYSGGCTAAALHPIVLILHEYLAGPCERSDEELIRKYTSKKFMRAASRATQWARTHPPPSPPPA